MDAVAAEVELLTPTQVSQRTGLSLAKVYRLIKSGALGHFDHGDTYRIPEPDLAAYLARKYVPARIEGSAA